MSGKETKNLGSRESETKSLFFVFCGLVTNHGPMDSGLINHLKKKLSTPPITTIFIKNTIKKIH